MLTLSSSIFATAEQHLEEITKNGRREIVEVAKSLKSKKLPLKKAILAPGLDIVVAPPVSRKSNSWTKGPIHRDYEGGNPGVCNFFLCMDDVTEENGAIELWEESKNVKIEKTNPERNLRKLKSRKLTGPKGTVFVFDARLIHRSLPNATTKSRSTLVWYALSHEVSKGFEV